MAALKVQLASWIHMKLNWFYIEFPATPILSEPLSQFRGKCPTPLLDLIVTAKCPYFKTWHGTKKNCGLKHNTCTVHITIQVLFSAKFEARPWWQWVNNLLSQQLDYQLITVISYTANLVSFEATLPQLVSKSYPKCVQFFSHNICWNVQKLIEFVLSVAVSNASVERLFVIMKNKGLISNFLDWHVQQNAYRTSAWENKL